MGGLKEGKKIGEIAIRGEINEDPLDIYRDKKYDSVAEQDLNTIMNCLSSTKYGAKLAGFCRGKKVLMRIRLEEDPFDNT
jgi:hypothetical protein